MFETLQDRLGKTIKTLRGQNRLTEENIDESLRDVRRAMRERWEREQARATMAGRRLALPPDVVPFVLPFLPPRPRLKSSSSSFGVPDSARITSSFATIELDVPFVKKFFTQSSCSAPTQAASLSTLHS